MMRALLITTLLLTAALASLSTSLRTDAQEAAVVAALPSAPSPTPCLANWQTGGVRCGHAQQPAMVLVRGQLFAIESNTASR